MDERTLGRRSFLKGALLGLGALASPRLLPAETRRATRPYTGPNVILVRFGGGVRRRETIDPIHTYAPYFLHELAPRGTLFTDMEISQLDGVETSHGQGTLYLLTGKYDHFRDVGGRLLGQRFEAQVPTLFEYLRKSFDVPEHQTLIVNGEDRTDEEFYTFSNHHLFGVHYRSNVLSLYRFKTYLLRRQLERGDLAAPVRREKRRLLQELESLDHRLGGGGSFPSPRIDAFWERWRRFYGESGLVNPRGDSLLTELAIQALDQLRPRLLMVNYNDPDYVHWGNPAHYTRGITVIDRGLKRLVAAVVADPEYRDNTLFVIVPDCGRDDNRLLRVPFQHHFNSRSSHEVFAVLLGPGIAPGRVVDHRVDQTSIATTVGHCMGFEAELAEGPVLEEALL